MTFRDHQPGLPRWTRDEMTNETAHATPLNNERSDAGTVLLTGPDSRDNWLPQEYPPYPSPQQLYLSPPQPWPAPPQWTVFPVEQPQSPVNIGRPDLLRAGTGGIAAPGYAQMHPARINFDFLPYNARGAFQPHQHRHSAPDSHRPNGQIPVTPPVAPVAVGYSPPLQSSSNRGRVPEVIGDRRRESAGRDQSGRRQSPQGVPARTTLEPHRTARLSWDRDVQMRRQADRERQQRDRPADTTHAGGGQGLTRWAEIGIGAVANVMGALVRPQINAETHVKPNVRAPPVPKVRRESSFDLDAVDTRPFRVRNGQIHRRDEVIQVDMLPDQAAVYQKLVKMAKQQLQNLADPSNQGVMTSWLLKLRLAANSLDLLNPDLRGQLQRNANHLAVPSAQTPGVSLAPSKALKIFAARETDQGEEEGDDICSVCLDSNTDTVTPCGHRFHQECIDDWCIQMKKKDCPMCRKPLNVRDCKPIDDSDVIVECAANLTKTTALRFEQNDAIELASMKVMKALEIISELVGEHKVLVLTNFKPVVKSMSQVLELAGTSCFLLTPEMDSHTREANIRRFKRHKKAVLLAMPRAASVKIDLSFVTTIVFLDPWRPSIFDQVATTMVCRSGATKSVTVFKLVARKTVEEEVVIHETEQQAMLQHPDVQAPAYPPIGLTGAAAASRIISGIVV